MNRFNFMFCIGETPIYECGGEYFKDTVCLNESAFGMFTYDSTGFIPVESPLEYKSIQALIAVNNRLRLISIVGYDKGVITVVVECSGEYEYFQLFGFTLDELTDGLSWKLAPLATRKTPSSFILPYKVKKDDLKEAH